MADFSQYEGILHLPHHISAVHPPMSRQDRAAQFSPFAALTGYEDAIAETARLTDRQLTLAEDETATLDACMQQVRAQLQAGSQPRVCLTVFEPDGQKSGGAYRTVEGHVRRLDLNERTLFLREGPAIPLDRVSGIQIPED